MEQMELKSYLEELVGSHLYYDSLSHITREELAYLYFKTLDVYTQLDYLMECCEPGEVSRIFLRIMQHNFEPADKYDDINEFLEDSGTVLISNLLNYFEKTVNNPLECEFNYTKDVYLLDQRELMRECQLLQSRRVEKSRRVA